MRAESRDARTLRARAPFPCHRAPRDVERRRPRSPPQNKRSPTPCVYLNAFLLAFSVSKYYSLIKLASSSHASARRSARSAHGSLVRRAPAGASQLRLAFRATWGGKRPGAGRKRTPGERARTPHRARPDHSPRHPVHVTLRSAFRPLRSQHVFPTLCLAVHGATRRDPSRFRILHFSAQWDHLHLVVEAADKRALSSGVRSLAIRIARSVNRLVSRSGRFWDDRWHGRALATPRQVRTALLYVLANFRKHDRVALRRGIDPFSSGALFDGWRGIPAGTPLPRAGPFAALARWLAVSRPRTWLARTGWRRAGLIRLDEAPRPSRSRIRDSPL